MPLFDFFGEFFIGQRFEVLYERIEVIVKGKDDRAAILYQFVMSALAVFVRSDTVTHGIAVAVNISIKISTIFEERVKAPRVFRRRDCRE